MGITTDRNDPGLGVIRADGQQETYLALSEEERAKGYVLPVRREYRHVACGTKTTMPVACAETYARDPKFYSGTFCCACGKHFLLTIRNRYTDKIEPAFLWHPDGDPVGASAEESQAFLAERKRQEEVRRADQLEHRRLCAIGNLAAIRDYDRAADEYQKRRAECGMEPKPFFAWSAQQLADMAAVKEGRPIE